MTLSVNTKNLIDEMSRAGVDAGILASLSTQLDNKPDADKVISNSFMAQKTFNSYRTNKDNEVIALKEKVEELSALHDSKGSLGNNPELLNAAAARITELEDLLIEEGYPPDKVRELSFKEKTEIEKVTKPNLEEVEEKEDKSMSQNLDPNKKYVDETVLADVLKTAMSNVAMGGVKMASKITKYAAKAVRLGIEVDDDKFETFPDALDKGFQAGKNEEQIADEHFGFSIKLKENENASVEARIKAAREEGAREALKNEGVTVSRTARKGSHPVLDRKPLSRVVTKPADKDVSIDNLPKNSANDPEFFRLRNFDEDQRRRAHTEKAASRFAELSETMDEEGTLYPVGT